MTVQLYGDSVQFIVFYDEEVPTLITHMRDLVAQGININIVLHERFICFTKKLSRQRMCIFENLFGQRLSSHVYFIHIVFDHSKPYRLQQFDDAFKKVHNEF